MTLSPDKSYGTIFFLNHSYPGEGFVESNAQKDENSNNNNQMQKEHALDSSIFDDYPIISLTIFISKGFLSVTS